MWRLSVVTGIVSVFLLGGQAMAFDYRIDPTVPNGSSLRFAFAGKSPLSTQPGPDEAQRARVPPEYATAMTWYRVALVNGYRPPLVIPSWTYGEQLPEPLQYTWSAPNGDLIARTGSGSFLLSFEDSDKNWFRELNCRMIQWPGGDAQAIINCNDGTQRTMLIPEEGGVVIGNQQYSRAFQQAPVNFDETLPVDYQTTDIDISVE